MYVLLDNSIKGIYFSCMYSIIMYVRTYLWSFVGPLYVVVIWLHMLPPMFSFYRINWRQQRTWLLVIYKEMTFNTSKHFCKVCVCVCSWSCVCACVHGRVFVHACVQFACMCECVHFCVCTVHDCTVHTQKCTCHLDVYIRTCTCVLFWV